MSEKPPVPEAPKAQTITTLLAEYGSIKSIPDELLDSVGYQRIEDGRVIRKGVEIKKSPLERKAEEVPFQEFSLDMKKTKKGRGVYESVEHEKLVDILSLKNAQWREYDGLLYPPLDPELESVMLPTEDQVTDAVIEDFWQRHPGLKDIYFEIAKPTEPDMLDAIRGSQADWRLDYLKEKSVLPFDILTEGYRLSDSEHPAKDLADEVSALYQKFFSADEPHDGLQEDAASKVLLCETMAEKISAFQARYGDTDYYKENDENRFDDGKEGATLFDLQKTIICEGLEKIGHPALAGVLANTKNRKELEVVRLSSDAEAVKRGKNEMKAASIEEKKILSQKLKEAKALHKREMQLLASVQAFFRPWETKAEVVRRASNKAIDFLMHGSDGDGSVTLRFDAMPDPVRDADPGVVSGDCTAGKPLPFLKGDNSLYNVKIFHEDEHRGNIYLLKDTVTRPGKERLEDEKAPIWYLDAIQLSMIVDWEQGFESLIEKLAKEASKKSVDYIGFSETEHLISNYSAISGAAKRYAQRHKLMPEYIELEQAEKTNIQFQGDVYLVRINDIIRRQNPFVTKP